MNYRSFSKRQLIAMTWWNRPKLCDFDGILCDGAVRSGKTVSLSVGFFLWSMSRFDGEVFALCGRTIGALQRNIVSNLPKWLGGVFHFRLSKSENKLTVTGGGRKNTYYLFGAADDTAASLIQGITLAGVLLDEAAILNRAFLEQACARCSVPGAKLWFSCNPQGPEHWFYKEWVCKAEEKKLLHLRFTMADNPALDEAVRARYERLYTGIFYRRFVLGQWCRAEGLVYDFDKERHVTKVLPEAGAYYISIDYGTMNPFSAGLWCVNGGRAVRIGEFYYCGRERGRLMTDREYADAVERLAAGRCIRRVVVDPSAASLIAELRSRGFRVRKAKNAVLPGIRLVAGFLQEGRLRIGENCRDCIREFGLYRWQEGADAPVKEDDHAMDEVRYFCATVLCRYGGVDGSSER